MGMLAHSASKYCSEGMKGDSDRYKPFSWTRSQKIAFLLWDGTWDQPWFYSGEGAQLILEKFSIEISPKKARQGPTQEDSRGHCCGPLTRIISIILTTVIRKTEKVKALIHASC